MMMRWTPWILGALLLAALAAKPAQAVVVDLTIIDTQGNPLPGYTFAFNWPQGKTSTLTTDSTGRLHGDVPAGGHFCSLWNEGLHMASGICNLTDAPGSAGDGGHKSGAAGKPGTSGDHQTSQANSIAPPPTASERAAASAVERAELATYKKRKDTAANRLWWGFLRAPAADHLIFLSGSRLGSYEFGVVLAQLFNLDGSDSGNGGGGDGGN